MASDPNQAVPASVPPDAAASPAPDRRARWWKIGALIGLFALGLAASWATRSHAPASHPEEDNQTPDQRGAHGARARKKSAAKVDLTSADGLLREGHWDKAFAAYRTLAAEPKGGALAHAITFRLALCHEILGQWSKALSAYQSIAAAGLPAETLAAHVGQARIQLLQRHAAAARTLLWPIVLQADRYGAESAPVAEARFLLAFALSQDALAHGPDGWLEHPSLPLASLPWALEQQLEWLTKPPPPAVDKQHDTLTFAIAKESGEPQLLEAKFVGMPFVKFVEALAIASKAKVIWTPAARQLIENRTVTLALSKHALGDVLRAVAATLDLACAIDKDTIRLTVADVLPEPLKAQHRQDLANRIMELAVERHPQHRLAPAACLALGHLAALQDPEEALATYEWLIQEWPNSRLIMDAQLQRGRLLRKDGKTAAAQQAFFAIVDQAPAHPQAAVALVHVGQMYLEQGDWRKARSLLQRGATTTTAAPTRFAAILTLAAAATLSDEPRTALTQLTKYREIWPDDAHRQMAAFLTAYARFRQAGPGKQLTRDSSELLIALLNAPDESALGPVGQYMRGMAYGDLAMWPQAAQIYEKTRAAAQGPLVQATTYRLAEALTRMQQNAAAGKLFTSLTESKGPWSDLASFQLAGLELQDNRLQDCVIRCHALLREPTALRLTDILSVMGRAYERQSDFARAAKCFAGQIPD